MTVHDRVMQSYYRTKIEIAKRLVAVDSTILCNPCFTNLSIMTGSAVVWTVNSRAAYFLSDQ